MVENRLRILDVKMEEKKPWAIDGENRRYLRVGDSLFYIASIDRFNRECACSVKLLELSDNSAKVRFLEDYMGKSHEITLRRENYLGDWVAVGTEIRPPVVIKKGTTIDIPVSYFSSDNELFWDLSQPVPADRVFCVARNEGVDYDDSVSRYYASGRQFDRC